MFINHRGIDTKKTIAGLLYHHLSGLGYHPFLDSKSMKPGDRLFEKIDPAIKECRVGVAIFSENYCNSYFCLHELALMLECKKRIVPIFCDVKPSALQVIDNGTWARKEIERFGQALEECRYIVGVSYDNKKNGDLAEFMAEATKAILQAFHEDEEDMEYLKHNITKYYDGNSAEASI
ncbi:TMV resistance protein N-like [Chenopodium quinoa]|nr:TMV resistance protein N-like [Chenopodium quinoa]